MTNKAVFFDRDGVINKPIVKKGRPFSPLKFEDFVLENGVIELTNAFSTAGYLLFIVTNQPEVARGRLDIIELDKMHCYISEKINIQEIFTCTHDAEDRCWCRKPSPGALFDLASRHDLSLPDSIFIGDRWKDIDAGNAAGCRTVFLDNGYSEKRPTEQDLTVSCLFELMTNLEI